MLKTDDKKKKPEKSSLEWTNSSNRGKSLLGFRMNKGKDAKKGSIEWRKKQNE